MYLNFKSRRQDIFLWENIFESLEDSLADASLQDKMEVFGAAVDEKLEQIIHDYGVEEAFRVEFWSNTEAEFSVMILSAGPDHEADMMELLSLCPIINLRYGEDADW